MEEFLDNLADLSLEVPASEFVEVSDLSPTEVGAFAKEWFKIPVERQRWAISTMVELAEDNPELDFCAIFKMCLRDRDEVVLEKAMEGLWESEDRSVIPSLVQVLRSNRGIEVRAAAAVALGKFAILVQDGKLLPKDADAVLTNLMAVLDNPQEPLEVRRRSLEAAAPFNTEDINKYVCWAYENGDPALKASAIFAMGRTGETSWLPILLRELQSNEPSVRYESANASAELGDEDVVPHLISLLQDDDYQVQMAGLNALGKIGGPLAKRALLRCMKDGDAVLEEAARLALETLEFLEDPMAFSSDP
jgi:HEAT repeat protein